MCGITGIFGPAGIQLDSQLITMANTMVHRGPDDMGIWCDSEVGIGFAHRRLSILDLSPQGAQPMVSASGRFVLCYNGEIYNHRAIRRELDVAHQIIWRGHSDTEVLVEAIERWGIGNTLDRCNGMFAFGLWDRSEQKLVLARDRMGEKPLYVGRVGNCFAFSSELKALRTLPAWRNSVDRRALSMFLRYGYVPSPWSIHECIFKLPPAATITLSAADLSSSFDLDAFNSCVRSYWSLSSVASNGVSVSTQVDDDSLLNRLDALLDDAVRMRMEADVPVGALLSGGVDSSLVAAMMQHASPTPVRTFTIGFQEDRFDEAPHARQVAAYLGTDHTELHLTSERALGVIPDLPEIYDEPFADASQIPTFLVSAISRQHVTVALSGDGGDELFFGYGRYGNALNAWRWISRLPNWGRQALVKGLTVAGLTIRRELGFRLQRLGNRFNASDFDNYYANLLSLSQVSTAKGHWPDGLPGEVIIPSQLSAPCERMMIADQRVYLPDDILVKTDRASMAASLELRVPLLDHRLVEFAWSLPKHLRWEDGSGKVLLRQLLYKYVPQELVDRPKQGFEIPLDDWLRGPLREWMLDLLSPDSLIQDGLLDARVVSSLIHEHLSRTGNHGYALWPVLMFQAWFQKYR